MVLRAAVDDLPVPETHIAFSILLPICRGRGLQLFWNRCPRGVYENPFSGLFPSTRSQNPPKNRFQNTLQNPVPEPSPNPIIVRTVPAPAGVLSSC